MEYREKKHGNKTIQRNWIQGTVDVNCFSGGKNVGLSDDSSVELKKRRNKCAETGIVYLYNLELVVVNKPVRQ